ncbi:hypothetical protein T10_13268 [Trichinella papuae]|uniref:PH domain-containing protein n=1 Tax=Trichinella papuae TaxID=268474 RepID=A0A0V1MCL3_9BILA|nr:hypothetical protein T10_13268 [Trichinella papuae]KRZ69087.1 hypothetical protein T10_13268 [Trichinella papuae]
MASLTIKEDTLLVSIVKSDSSSISKVQSMKRRHVRLSLMSRQQAATLTISLVVLDCHCQVLQIQLKDVKSVRLVQADLKKSRILLNTDFSDVLIEAKDEAETNQWLNAISRIIALIAERFINSYFHLIVVGRKDAEAIGLFGNQYLLAISYNGWLVFYDCDTFEPDLDVTICALQGVSTRTQRSRAFIKRQIVTLLFRSGFELFKSSKVTTAVSFQAADAVGLESCLTELIQTLHRNQIEKVVEHRHSTGSRMKDTSTGVALRGSLKSIREFGSYIRKNFNSIFESSSSSSSSNLKSNGIQSYGRCPPPLPSKQQLEAMEVQARLSPDSLSANNSSVNTAVLTLPSPMTSPPPSFSHPDYKLITLDTPVSQSVRNLASGRPKSPLKNTYVNFTEPSALRTHARSTSDQSQQAVDENYKMVPCNVPLICGRPPKYLPDRELPSLDVSFTN